MVDRKVDVIKRKPSWAPPFRIEVDGKYVHLWGIDKDILSWGYGGTYHAEEYLSGTAIQMHRSWDYNVQITSITDTEITIEAVGTKREDNGGCKGIS